MSFIICGGLQWGNNLLPSFHLERGQHLKIIWAGPLDSELKSRLFQVLAGQEVDSQWWMEHPAAVASIAAWKSFVPLVPQGRWGALKKIWRRNNPKIPAKTNAIQNRSDYLGSHFMLRSIYGVHQVTEQDIRALSEKMGQTIVPDWGWNHRNLLSIDAASREADVIVYYTAGCDREGVLLINRYIEKQLADGNKSYIEIDSDNNGRFHVTPTYPSKILRVERQSTPL